MAEYPNAIKNFLQLEDGVDTVVAQHPNERGDEITALQTFIGAIGSQQSYSESLKNLLLDYRNGCLVAYKSASDIYVRAGKIVIKDASGNIRLRRNISDLTVNWTNIDTGAEEASTTYYIYALADTSGTTFTVKISKSASLPSGATFYFLLGTFYNDAGSNIVESSILNSNTGKIVNIIHTQTGAVATGTTTIPYDDTIPENTEGNEYMTLTITPTSATNKLKIDVVFHGGENNGERVVVALFQDTTANALATGFMSTGAASEQPRNIKFTHYMTAGTTSATTFKVRAGTSTGGTTTFNGVGGARKFGGTIASSITITEIQA